MFNCLTVYSSTQTSIYFIIISVLKKPDKNLDWHYSIKLHYDYFR